MNKHKHKYIPDLSCGPFIPESWADRLLGSLHEKKEVLNKAVAHAPLVHGGMKYRCEKCGKSWFMNLEIGVEDHGTNGRPHQPSPFMIICDCGGWAQDISGYIPLPEQMPLLPGMRYFAYDHSGRRNACGIPKIYKGD